MEEQPTLSALTENMRVHSKDIYSQEYRICKGKAAIVFTLYLPDLSGTRKEHMGERLPCTIRSVTEVRAVTEETLAVRAVGSATLAPNTVTQVRVIGDHWGCAQSEE